MKIKFAVTLLCNYSYHQGIRNIDPHIMEVAVANQENNGCGNRANACIEVVSTSNLAMATMLI